MKQNLRADQNQQHKSFSGLKKIGNQCFAIFALLRKGFYIQEHIVLKQNCGTSSLPYSRCRCDIVPFSEPANNSGVICTHSTTRTTEIEAYINRMTRASSASHQTESIPLLLVITASQVTDTFKHIRACSGQIKTLLINAMQNTALS